MLLMFSAMTEDGVQRHRNPAAEKGQRHQDEQRHCDIQAFHFDGVVMPPAFAEKHHEEQAEGVNPREKGADDPAEPKPQPLSFDFERGDQDLVLAEIAGSVGEGRQREAADEKTQESDRKLFALRPHAEDVLFVMQAENDRAGAEEEQRLEEGVGHQVENRSRPGADAEAEKHVADLGYRRIRENPLDVVLGHGGESRHQQGDQPDPGDEQLNVGREFEQRMGAGDQVNARRDHGGRVDQGADRSRARHGVGKPGLQGQLGRFADRAAKQQQRGDGGQSRADRPFRLGRMQHFLDVQGAELGEQQEQADGHGRIADPGNDEGLARGITVVRIVVPEPDQQVAAQSDAFPAQIQQEQIIAEHEQQHGEDEQVHVAEKAAEVRVVGHVAGGIDVDQEANPGNDQNHHQREAVEIEIDAGVKAGHGHPGPDGDGMAFDSRLQEAHGHQRRHGKGQADAAGADPARRTPGKLALGQGQDQKSEQRKCRQQPDQIKHSPYPFNSLSTLMSTVWKRRYI